VISPISGRGSYQNATWDHLGIKKLMRGHAELEAVLSNLEAHARTVQSSRRAGWTVCRFNGARGGAPKGKANGSYKHGFHTQEAKAERRLLSDLLRQSRKTIVALPKQEEK
jgi:hypothetical protein